MPSEPTNPTRSASPGSASAISLSASQVIGLFVAVLGVIVVLTLVLAFHYSKASDTTSVLGVAFPALSAIVGAALGGGAGNAVGAAGKKGVQQDLAQANKKLTSASSEVASIRSNIEPVFEMLKRDLPSPAGESRLMLVGLTDPQQVASQGIDPRNLEGITTSLGRLEGLIGNSVIQPDDRTVPE